MVSTYVQLVQCESSREIVRSWISRLIVNLLHLLFIPLLFQGSIPLANGQEQSPVRLLHSHHTYS